ncbi:MAG: PD-(D/E)XK nuclease family protein [Leptolyngbya sp. Prado105]|jgi:putative RecB family exonuclease|nr:PD-(D/E)XK nuclease family protein [Leptolyngbya sp. Prado105]
MPYQISATKLQAYSRCPYAYYLRYERRLTSNDFFGSAALGTALHQALAMVHRDWHYHDSIPDRAWVLRCWDEASESLTTNQFEDGRSILENYYETFIQNEQHSLRKPLAVEGRIQAFLQVESLEFCITGRYDRIDYLDDGLELIDYKSSRELKVPESDEMDLQIGLYYLALEQTYHQSLKYLSLLFLRTAEKVRFKATDRHKKQVQAVISDLAMRLRQDETWEPTPGKQCDRCAYSRYCSAVNLEPAPLPSTASASPELQLALGL